MVIRVGAGQRWWPSPFASVINSALLLLRSASDQHPNGIANCSYVVGRHYMAHLNSAMIATSTEPNPMTFQKTLGVNDCYWGADDFGLPLGHIQTLGRQDRGVLLKAGTPSGRPTTWVRATPGRPSRRR